MKQQRIFQQVVSVILFSFLLVGCSMYLSQDTSTPITVDAIQTSKPTFTPTVSRTLSPSVTPSRRPTLTATPIPEWVTDFAKPILAAIANRPPDFQEDFSQASTVWQQANNNFSADGVISDGVLILSAVPVNGKDAWDQQLIPCCLDYKTFVLRVDVNTEKLFGENAAGITYSDSRLEGGRFNVVFEYYFELKSIRRWYSQGGDIGRLSRSVSPQITFTLISQGSRFAVYLNDIPITFGKYAGGQYKTELLLSAWSDGIGTARVEYDNLMIWNLDNIPNLPKDE